MALTEIKELRSAQPVATPYYTGTAYGRTFRCAPGETATHLTGSLDAGNPLLTAWGGDGNSTDAYVPRLQSAPVSRMKAGGLDEIRATFVGVNTVGAVATTYIQTDKTRGIGDSQFETVYEVYGVDTVESGSAGAPEVGDSLDTTAGVQNRICFHTQAVPEFEHGRSLIISRWRGAQPYASRDVGGDY